MRILAVLYCYPPLLVPAAMCYMKLMAGLVENGIDVEILTIDPRSFDSPGPTPLDADLAEAAPDEIVNHVVWSPERSRLVRGLKWLDKDRRFTWPWLEPRKREWVKPALRKLRELDLDSYDLLLTCSQPHSNHLLGFEWRRRTGAPWVAYFSDPWTDNPYAHFGSERVRQYHRGLEDAVLSSASLVLYTCEEMRRLVVERHALLDPGRTGVLPHAFVPEWYGEPLQHLDAGPLRLLHTGSFYGPRTPLPLIDALWRVSQQEPLHSALRIDSYGGMDERWKRLIAERNLRDVFAVHGFIPYLESLDLMRDSDALLLVDAALSSTDESVFLPSKLVDYLGANVPIIAVTPSEGATARVVRETGGWVVPIERPEELDRLLQGMVRDRTLPAPPDAEAARAFEYRNVGRELADRFRMLLDAPPLTVVRRDR